MRLTLPRLALGLLLGAFGPAHAGFAIPGFELVYSTPVETSLVNPDLRSAADVWCELFDQAKRELVIGQYYVAGKAGEELDRVIAHLDAAGRRGVRIRFLVDPKGPSDAPTLDRLRAIPNLELRLLDFAKLGGSGIIHAKYIVADGAVAFVGSQNFDWRALAHIHETGLRISDPAIVAQLRSIFEADWAAQQAIAAGGRAAPVTAVHPPGPDTGNYLVASPRAFTPAGIVDSEAELPRLLAGARREVRVQMLDYAPLDYGPDNTRPYYAVIDNALRAAAVRGVKIKLMVSNWNLEAPMLAHLKSLALLPNIEIRVVTLPQPKAGFVPFGRVIHSKTMAIDGQLAWVGTSNWSGGYFNNSRNLEIVMRDARMAARVAALHEQAWTSPYAQPLRIDYNYPAPAKAKPE
jgi:phosphatidylserine/phosphatidylglycerophosphate/cardiolipin synthase-like enzyme